MNSKKRRIWLPFLNKVVDGKTFYKVDDTLKSKPAVYCQEWVYNQSQRKKTLE